MSYSDVLSGGAYVEQRQVTAFNGRRLTFKQDKMGRLSEKTLEVPASPAPPAVPAAWTTEATLSFSYTPQGWLKKVAEIRTGSSARYTFFGYDSYGRLTKKDSPEGVLAYAYLPNGSVDTLKGYPRSVVAQPVNPATATDALALPTSPVPVPDVSLKYEYDRLGRLQKVSDLDGTGLSFANDSFKTLYAYDANGNLEAVRYPESGALSVEHKYVYTAQNRLKQLDLQRVNRTTGLPATRLFSFLYHLNASGQRIAVIEDDVPVNVGTSRAVQYVYDTDDADNTPSTTPDPQPRARLNRLSQELVTTYDESVPRLDEVDGTLPHFFHRYDLVGNRTYSKQVPTPTVPDSVVTLQPYYDNRDRLDSDSIPGNANAIYDANGNTLTLKSMTLGVSSYDESPNAAAGNVPAGDTYDAENRLVKRVVREVYDANKWRQTTLVLTYDHAGNRVSKVKTVENRLKDSPYTASGTTTTTTTYLVDELNLTGYAQVLAEYQSVGAGSLLLNRAYAYGLDLVSQRIGGSSTRDYYGYDGHGSVRRLLTVSGDRVLSGPGTQPDYTYDAYGRLLASTDTTNPPRNVYRYAGEQWDADLGLSYNRARYLSPSTGRFWSMDSYEGSPSDPASLHKYLYCQGNPVNRIDPSGNSDFIQILNTFSIHAYLRSSQLIVAHPIYTTLGGIAVSVAFPQLEAIPPGHPSPLDEMGQLGRIIRRGIAQGLAKLADNGHHPLPKFLGGAKIQELVTIPRHVHDTFHRILNERLKAKGFPLGGLGGRGNTAAAWQRHFQANKGSQDKAFEAVLEAARDIDAAYEAEISKTGTTMTRAVWQSIIEGKFTAIP